MFEGVVKFCQVVKEKVKECWGGFTGAVDRHKEKLAIGGSVVASGMLYEGMAHAAFTMPTLPVTDLETAGTAVAALVASFVIIKMVIRMIKGG